MNLVRTLAVSKAILFAHWQRTALSCFALFIGVSGVVVLVGTGRAAELDFLARIRRMGSLVLRVESAALERVGRRYVPVGVASTLTQEDAAAIRRMLPGVRSIAGIARESRVVLTQSTRLTAVLVGVEPNVFGIQRFGLGSGRFFVEQEERIAGRVAVLGAAIARDVFAGGPAVGERLRVGGVTLVVVGVAAESGAEGGEVERDKCVFVPLRTALYRILRRTYLNEIVLQAEDRAALAGLQRDIRGVLRQRHRIAADRADDFVVRDPAFLARAESTTRSGFRSLVLGGAILGLLSGGVGILVVMLMAIRERTREIGLRRAIGARRRDIALQMLLEAGMLAGLGGAGGAMAGLLGNVLLCRALGWPDVLPMDAALLAGAISVAVGTLSGVIPAIRAAAMEPAGALRAQ